MVKTIPRVHSGQTGQLAQELDVFGKRQWLLLGPRESGRTQEHIIAALQNEKTVCCQSSGKLS
jgi:hypothetical protein